MRTKQLLQHLPVLGILLLGGAHQALAQEDESWYKTVTRQRALQQAKASGQKPTAMQLTTEECSSSCDVSTNGNFENQRVAPSRTGNMGGQLTGQNAPDELNNWYSPTYGTPDYLATNGTQIDVRPQEESGVSASSTPYCGSGEIGLYSRQTYDDGISRDRVSEYATQRLATPLGIGSQYYVEMWVSLSHSKNICNYGIANSFGASFSTGNGFQTMGSRDFLSVPSGAKTVFNNSPIGQSALNYGNLGATSWQRISGQVAGNGEQYVTLGLFNSDSNNLTLLPGGNSGRPNTYVFVDAFKFYRIPTAGVATSVNCNTPTVIGEGCSIPGATYAWRVQGGSSTPFATSIQTNVPSQSTPTTYVLTVTLPDNTTYASTVYVTGTNAPPAYPIVTQFWAQEDQCTNTDHFVIANYSSAYTYTLQSGPQRVTFVPTGDPSTFIVKTTGARPGNFTVTVSGCGSSVTTSLIEATYPCDGPAAYRTSSTLAYPNPTTESLTVPQDASETVLLDNQGQIVKKPGRNGKLDVQSLPSGLYNLRMKQNGKVVNQRIQVQH